MYRYLCLFSIVWASPAVAQQALKPELMLLIDGSHKMGKPLHLGDPTCDPSGREVPDRPWANQTPETPLNMVKEALLGTVKAPEGVRWCTQEDAAHRNSVHDLRADGPHAHVRQMCCREMNGDQCKAWAPCYADNGQLDDPDAVALDSRLARIPDGLLARHLEDVKFGLMFSDGMPDPQSSAAGHYSYGSDTLRINGQRINVGARAPAPPGRLHVGALIDPDRGMLSPGNGNVNNGRVGESDAKVGRHTQFVQWMVSRLVPHGLSVASGLLHDAVEFFEPQAAQCRTRQAVLITRGHEDPVLPGLNPGAPYDPAADYANTLRREGVTLHVILIATAAEPGQANWAQQIASRGGGTYARVDSAVGVRKALRAIIDAERNGTRAQGRTLVVGATPADYCPNDVPCNVPNDVTLQWRVSAFAEMIDGTAYGRIHAQQVTCEAPVEGVPQPKAQPLAYEEVLARRTAMPRRTVALHPRDDETMIVTGGPNAGFGDLGENQMGAPALLAGLFELDLDTFGDAINGGSHDDDAATVPANPSRGRAGGLLLNGFFGPRGLGPNAERQLGATITGDIVSLRSPSLGLTDPAYLGYRNAMQERKSLIATGARDGLVHVFRAEDGVEVINFMPIASWKTVATGNAPADGPLTVADIVPGRRLDGQGGPDCPANLTFESWMFGSAGTAAANLFGVHLADALNLAEQPDRALKLRDDVGLDGVWDVTAEGLAPVLERAGSPAEVTLGAGTSRPAITHVRNQQKIQAAVVVGCGMGPPPQGFASGGPGHCALVLDATTGELIHRFDAVNTPDMMALLAIPPGPSSLSGSPVVFPSGGITPASRAYIGDAMGRIWRMDLRDTNPGNWTMSVAWPPAQYDGAYQLGRAVVDRPSIAVRPDGAVVVSFVTDRTGEGNLDRAYAVSFTDKAAIGQNGVEYTVTPNWEIPLRTGEYGTGAPVVRDEVLYFTTRQDSNAGACGAVTGRIYGVDYYRPYVNSDGDPDTYLTEGDQPANARPALQVAEGAAIEGHKGLSIVLPPGRVSYGLAIARTPSCSPEAPATTTMVLNVADAPPQTRVAPVGAVDQAQIEVVLPGGIAAQALQGNIFMQPQGNTLAICLDCTPDGAPAQGALGHSQELPFPTQVVYWGSTFLN
jgi:hypothetical protein